MGGLGAEGPEVPLHGVAAQAGRVFPTLRVDEVRELDGVPDEEDRRVVADEVVVALFGVELQSEATRVSPGVRRALLAGDGGEPCQHRGLDALLEQTGAGDVRDVLGGLELAERAGSLGVGDALGNILTVEVRELLDQVEVVQRLRALAADLGAELVVGHRHTAIGGGGRLGGDISYAAIGGMRSHVSCSSEVGWSCGVVCVSVCDE